VLFDELLVQHNCQRHPDFLSCRQKEEDSICAATKISAEAQENDAAEMTIILEPD
jgi:hypothetical protein